MKSKYYKISKIDDSSVLILSISYHSPTEQLERIENELSKKKFHGKVFFDLLLTNDNSKQRFFEAYFEKQSIDKDKFKNITDQVENIKKISRTFYMKNFDLIEQSEILTKATKFLIKNGRF